jgi:hypothetical protein
VLFGLVVRDHVVNNAPGACAAESDIQLLLGIFLDALQFHTERIVSSVISGQVVDVHPRPENLRSLQRDAGQGIEVCELNGVNSFRYLTELQRHAADVKHAPADWMPWTFAVTLAGMQASAARRRQSGQAAFERLRAAASRHHAEVP